MEKSIKVNGMTCQKCVKKINTKLKSAKGVKTVKVDLLNKQVKVNYNNKQTSIDKIKSEIEKLGYDTSNKKDSTIKGITYGLIPHIGCIGFIIASIIGATTLITLFKPLMMNRYFFYILILISLGFAAISSIFYLRKHSELNWAGIKENKGYLSTMFGLTLGINLLLFFVIFPLTANITIDETLDTTQLAGAGTDTQASMEQISLKVSIPCPGHAPLISNELKTLSGVKNIKYSFPDKFNVDYDSTQTTREDIFGLEVFKSYPALELSN